MLSRRGFNGNVGRSFWLAGVALPARGQAWNGWLRTVTAAQMPKTAAIPAGYGENSLALPQLPGAFASRRVGFQIDVAADLVGGYAQGASIDFQVDVEDSGVFGEGFVEAAAPFQVNVAADLDGAAPLEATIPFQINLNGAIEAAATLEALIDFQVDLTGDLTATAPIESVISFQMDVVPNIAGAIEAQATISFQVDLVGNGLTGIGAVEATLPFSGTVGAELTAEGIAQATLDALNSTTIPVNVKKMNDADVLGDGTSGNKWRGE